MSSEYLTTRIAVADSGSGQVHSPWRGCTFPA
jgi:hypothetical protein